MRSEPGRLAWSRISAAPVGREHTLAAERSNIDTVIIGGRVRKRGGVVLGVDRDRLRAAIDESCAHLFEAAGYRSDLFAESFAPIHHAQ